MWDVLTRPSSICAVLVILCVQYRSSVVDLIYIAKEDGTVQTFLNLHFRFADILRGWYHISLEIVRNFGQKHIFSFGDGSDCVKYARQPLSHREASHSKNNDAVEGSSRKGSHKSYLSQGQPPPLVLVTDDTPYTKNESMETTIDSPCVLTTSKSSASQGENEKDSLAPAFLCRDDYPEGWLIYHSVLGVISLTEAERYDEQQLLDKGKSDKNQDYRKKNTLHFQSATNETGIRLAKTIATGSDGS